MADQYLTSEVIGVDAQGKEIERHQVQVEYRRESLTPEVDLDLMRIPAGEFTMGAPDHEKDREVDEGPQHIVSMPGFWMGRTPVTQAQWRAVATLPKVNRDLNTTPSTFQGDQRPVENVRWAEAIEFCDRLCQLSASRRADNPVWTYRLPSEAEWEYACRAGTTTPYHFGPTITPDLANYNGTAPYGRGPRGPYRATTTEVGYFNVSNGFGLFDLYGNVWEWCLDTWHDHYQKAPADGSAWTTGGDDTYRILRGGSWGNSPWYCRSANRGRAKPDNNSNYFGFRIVGI
jgi:formylglycine-generating enzyme required for sulfatase activity